MFTIVQCGTNSHLNASKLQHFIACHTNTHTFVTITEALQHLCCSFSAAPVGRSNVTCLHNGGHMRTIPQQHVSNEYMYTTYVCT